MKNELIRLKEMRQKQESLVEKRKKLYDMLMIELEPLSKEIEENKVLMETTTENIKSIALEKFKETGEKKLEYGVAVKIMNKLQYDEKQALKWAKDHSMALNLDKRSFEKIAKADPMEFVEMIETPTATIPTKIEVE